MGIGSLEWGQASAAQGNAGYAGRRPARERPHSNSKDDELGRWLAERDLISWNDLRIARQLADAAGVSLGRVLLAEGFIDQNTLLSALQAVTGLPFASRAALRSALARLSRSAASDVLNTGYLPLTVDGGVVLHATADPAPWSGVAMGMAVASLTTWDELRGACRDVWGGAILHEARSGLAEAAPELSARMRLSRGQAAVLFGLGCLTTVGLWLAPAMTVTAVAIVLSLAFLSVIAIKGLALVLDREEHHTVIPPMIADRDLPVYSILVPIFRETEVLDDLVGALLGLDYPASKLDIILILEQEDVETRAAVAAMKLPDCFQTIVVPKALPQTKPKALNYAMAFVRGQFLVIYDAEDQPEPDQLRLAVAQFQAEDDSLACIQCRLAYYNYDENWLTRQFAIEYAMLFDMFLPVLARLGLPLPLGGTSNHFRVEALRRAGGWDAHNVTEDADLGLRLARLGYRVGVLASTTFEEANCELGNWLRQRSRWIKGWIQTWFVHNRKPLKLLREMGLPGFLTFQAVTAGIILAGLLHPVCMAFVGWKLLSIDWSPSDAGIVEWILIGLGAVVFTSGAIVAGGSAWAAIHNRPELSCLRLSLLTMPAYWILMSIGAWYALWEFIRRPFHWQKTRHGLTRQRGRETSKKAQP